MIMHAYDDSSPTRNDSSNDDLHDLEFSKHKGCCFFNIPFFFNEPSNNIDHSASWQRINNETAVPSAVKDDPWWFRGWLKIREWSELVAGPRWKTLIRRFNKRSRHGNQAHGKFQYDPLSYSLNFDEGPGQNCHYEEDDIVGRGFSSRYSLPPSAQNSLDFDKEGLVFA